MPQKPAGSKRPRIRGYDKHIDVDRAGADERFDTFEVSLARAALRLNPKRVEALMMLGHSLTRLGRHRQALAVDQKLSDLMPSDPLVHYNLACSHANLDDVDAALDALSRALDLGYRDFSYLLSDPDMKNVRRDPRFKKLLDRKWGKRQP